jgi:hypothetical protein
MNTPNNLYGLLKYVATLAAGLVLFHLVYRNGFSAEKDLPTLAAILAVFGLGDKFQSVMKKRASQTADPAVGPPEQESAG